MKRWYLEKMIQLCNFCLRFSDGAEDQEDINEVVKWKNEFIADLRKLNN